MSSTRSSWTRDDRVMLRSIGFGLLILAATRAAAAPAPDVAPGWTAQRWTTDDGLPVNGLNGLAQTPDGFLWIATSGGLVRFDGLDFEVVGGPLSNARLTRVEVGPDGRIFAASDERVLYTIGPGGITEHPLRVAGITRRGDALWIGAESGLLRAVGDGFEHIGPGVTGGLVTGAFDREGRLWLASRARGLLRVERGRPIPVALPDPGARTVYDLRADAEGLWVASDTGLYRIDQRGVRRIPPPPGVQPEVFTFVDIPGHGLLAAGYGLWSLGADGSARPHLEPNPIALVDRPAVAHFEGSILSRRGDGLWLGGQRLIPGRMTSVLVTDDGSIWTADDRGRLTRLQRRAIEPLGGAAAACNAYGMHQDRAGHLWVGCMNRSLRFDREHLDGPAHLAAAEPIDGRCYGFTEQGGQVICAGDRPLAVEADRLRPIPDLEAYAARTILVDQRGVLWAGGRYALRRRGPDGRVRTLADARGEPIADVIAGYEADDGWLWLSSRGAGLVRIDPEAGTVERFGAAQGQPSRRIRAIHPAAGGGLWLGTEERGLLHARFDGERPAITEIRRADGLFVDHVHQILPDGRGRLWMSSNRGLFWASEADLLDFVAGRRARVDPVAYDTADGMPHREANGGSHASGLVLRDGRLVFPTQVGVAVLDPRHIERDMQPPRVHIERVEAGGRRLVERLTGLAISDQPLQLAPDERDFTVTYTAPVFRHPERVRFRYRLEGYDERWVEAGDRRQAFYTRVPPGRYTFRVTAANAHHIWHPDGVTFDVEVVPRFFETWWFGALSLLAGFALLAGLGRLRFARMRAQAEHLEAQVALRTAELARQAEALAALDELKTRFFAHISHELRTPLTLIAGAVERLPDRDDGGTTDALRRNTRRLRRLTDQILDLLRGEAGLRHVTLQSVELAALADATIAAFAPVTERLHFSARGEGIALAHPGLIETVLVNLVSNAVKFTEDGGRISLDISRHGDRIRLAVEDDGRGIPPGDLPHIFDRFYRVESATLREGEGTGLGLALVRELVTQQGGAVRVESALGQGTRFVIELQATDGPADEHRWGRQGRDEASLLDGDGPSDDPADDRPRVLVVDDNADLRRWVGRALATEYAVIYAEDGAQGLDRAREALPDLIVADVMMPRLDGFGLVRALADDPETACVPVLLLTARASPQAELTGLRAGAIDFMTKPFDIEILAARSKAIINRRSRLRDALRVELAAAEEALRTPANAAEPTVVEQARAVIEARIDDPELNLPSLARALGMSRATLGRRLADEQGPTPGALIREVRLDRARELLAAGRGSISEVAFAVGFNSHAQFSRRFKARYGRSPSAFKSTS